jgi:Fe-Mn family superoxide dismutase
MESTSQKTEGQSLTYPFQLAPLPYAFDALEPVIDAQTMQLHHDKHHQTYVDKLNEALKDHTEFHNRPLEQILQNLSEVPESARTAVRNHGGGHVNHTMFWQIMKPQGGGEPTGAIADAIKQSFGGFEDMKKQFNEAGVKQFGSGWAWLVRSKDDKLQIVSTANQDNPLSQGHFPILGNDVWEHAYYLKYNNRRSDYLAAWWNTVNWEEVNKRFQQAQSA